MSTRLDLQVVSSPTPIGGEMTLDPTQMSLEGCLSRDASGSAVRVKSEDS